MGLLYEDFNRERKEWEKERKEAKEAKEGAEEKSKSLAVKLEEYEAHMEAVGKGEEN